jgi:hypothetical protein
VLSSDTALLLTLARHMLFGSTVQRMVGPSGGRFRMVTEKERRLVEDDVPYKESTWGMYYTAVAQHLLLGKPVPVTPEEGRRSVAVMETAEKSAESGHTETVPVA